MEKIPDHIEEALNAIEAELLIRIAEKANPEDYLVFNEIAGSERDLSGYRRKAIYMLGRWPDPDQYNASVETIQAIYPELMELERIAAIDALGRIGTPEALELVLYSTNDKSADVRRFTVKALDRIGTPETILVLEEMSANDESDIVRDLASHAVQRHAPPHSRT